MVKALGKNLLLAASSLLVFLLLLEGILTLRGYGQLVLYKPDPMLFWSVKPDQKCYTKFGHKPVNINSHGTRGRDFAAEKPKGVYRILSLGDSKTFGWGVSDSETYSALLAEMLQEHVGDSMRVEVINAGVNAWSYAQMYVYLRETGMKYDPDLVILADANLWSQFSEDASESFRKAFLRRVWIKNLLRRSALYHYFIEVKLVRYYVKYRTRFIPVEPENDDLFEGEQKQDPHLFMENQIRNICRLTDENGVGCILMYMPARNELEDPSFTSEILELRTKKEKVGRELGIPFIDLLGDFARSQSELYLEGDAFHVNELGHKIIAERLFDYMVENVSVHSASSR